MDSDESVRIEDRQAESGTPRADIVVGIDESQASAAALRWAVAHAKLSGQPLRLVHAWQMPAAASRAVAMGAGAYPAAAAADARARATQWVLETLGLSASEVRWTLSIHEGGAGQVLSAAADGAPLVVVGTHEHTGLRRAIRGSVSHYVLSHSHGPVVAVPGAAQDEGPARSHPSPPVATASHP